MARSYERSLLIREGFSCFSDPPSGRPKGGVLVTVGAWLAGEPWFTAYGRNIQLPVDFS